MLLLEKVSEVIFTAARLDWVGWLRFKPTTHTVHVSPLNKYTLHVAGFQASIA